MTCCYFHSGRSIYDYPTLVFRADIEKHRLALRLNGKTKVGRAYLNDISVSMTTQYPFSESFYSESLEQYPLQDNQ